MSLTLRFRKGSFDPQPWPRAGEPLRLDGEREYIVEGPAEELDRVAQCFGRFAERFAGTVLLAFGNAVGRFDVPGYAPLVVVSGKWEESHFDAMMADIARAASALPFSSGDAGRANAQFASHQDEALAYHQFLCLRWLLSDAAGPEGLRPAVSSIVASPHRSFQREHQVVPVARARGCDATSLVRITRERRFERSPPALAGLPLVRALEGQLPAVVHEPSVFSSVDAAENRFVKAALGRAMSLARFIKEHASGRTSFAQRTRRDAEDIERWALRALQHRFWDAVGPMQQVPAASTVLRQRYGYRQVFRAFELLRHAAQWLPFSSEDARALIEVKDIARLYELWCFFMVVEEVTRVLAERPQTVDRSEAGPMDASVAPGFSVRWSRVAIVYNASFTRGGQTRRSYSLLLRPDVTLELRQAGRLEHHLFDAKFKVKSVWKLDENGAETDEGRATREDLQKMHTYRDAIPSASTAWVLYPGLSSERTWFPAGDPQVNEGIGAIPLLPDSEGSVLAAVLSTMLVPLVARGDLVEGDRPGPERAN